MSENINLIPQINPYSLNFTILNSLLENGKIIHTITGRRFVIIKHGQVSLGNPNALGIIDFNTLSQMITQKISNYPIINDEVELDFKKASLCQKLDQDRIIKFLKYSEEMAQAEHVLKKITTLDKTSKEAIKKASIITRIFFFFTQLFFNKTFACDMEQTKIFIAAHQDILKTIELKLKPFGDFQKNRQESQINSIKYFQIFQGTLAISMFVNFIFSNMNIQIPYISRILNVATPALFMSGPLFSLYNNYN